jgi:hypothetical protein
MLESSMGAENAAAAIGWWPLWCQLRTPVTVPSVLVISPSVCVLACQVLGDYSIEVVAQAVRLQSCVIDSEALQMHLGSVLALEAVQARAAADQVFAELPEVSYPPLESTPTPSNRELPTCSQGPPDGEACAGCPVGGVICPSNRQQSSGMLLRWDIWQGSDPRCSTALEAKVKVAEAAEEKSAENQDRLEALDAELSKPGTVGLIANVVSNSIWDWSARHSTTCWQPKSLVRRVLGCVLRRGPAR